MLIGLYSIYDRVAKVYADPFVSVNDATAARSFSLAQSSPDSMLYTSPADFQLWYIGSLNNHTGALVTSGHFEPHKVADGVPNEVVDHEQ